MAQAQGQEPKKDNGSEALNTNTQSGKSATSSTENKQAGSQTSGGWQSGNSGKMSAIPGGRKEDKADKSDNDSEGPEAATSELFRKGKDMVTDFAGKASEFSSDNLKEIGGMLKKYPVQSLAIGFGAGVLVGALVSRR